MDGCWYDFDGKAGFGLGAFFETLQVQENGSQATVESSHADPAWRQNLGYISRPVIIEKIMQCKLNLTLVAAKLINEDPLRDTLTELLWKMQSCC